MDLWNNNRIMYFSHFYFYFEKIIHSKVVETKFLEGALGQISKYTL